MYLEKLTIWNGVKYSHNPKQVRGMLEQERN